MRPVNSIGTERSATSGIDSFALKVIAILGMTLNHIGVIFADTLPFAWECVFVAFGGVTFPIMAFLVVEGYRHTSSLRRYMTRLLAFAIVSQLPYSLVFEPMAVDLGSGPIALPFTGNVLFTLLLGLGLIALHDRMRSTAAFWAIFVLADLASLLLDWGVIGPIMIVVSHLVKDESERRVFTGLLPVLALGIPSLSEVLSGGTGLEQLPALLYEAVGGVLAIALLLGYDGTRGKPLKWLFYLYYPLHLAALGAMHALMLG